MADCNAGKRRFANSDERRIVATYDYRDEDGRLLYQVVRFDPKGFAQRRPLADEGWAWGLDPSTRRVPYRMPDLLSRPTDPVVIVEGEKDADAIAAFGWLATCNSGGAGKWWFGWGGLFVGRRVAIIPDNDTIGFDHAVNVAADLLAWSTHPGYFGEIECLKIVHLPNLPAGGDVSDWLAASSLAGKSEAEKKAELARLIRESPSWTLTKWKAAA